MYRTQASEDLVDTLQCRIARFEHNLTTDLTPTQRAVNTAWLDATKLALHEVYLAAPKIEAEAELVPEDESEMDVLAQAKKVVDDLFPSQSVAFRDYFGLDAA